MVKKDSMVEEGGWTERVKMSPGVSSVNLVGLYK